MKPIFKIIILVFVFPLAIQFYANANDNSLEYYNEFKSKYHSLIEDTDVDSIYFALYSKLNYESLDGIVNRFVSSDVTSLSSKRDDDIFVLNESESELILFFDKCCGLQLLFNNVGYFYAPDLAYLKAWYENNKKYITEDQINAYLRYRTLVIIYYGDKKRFDHYTLYGNLRNRDPNNFNYDVITIDYVLDDEITILQNDFFKRVYADYYRELDEKRE